MEKRQRYERLDGEKMRDLIIMVVFGVFLYIFYRWMVKLPILPWKEAKHIEVSPSKPNSKRKKHYVNLEDEPLLFKELFKDIKDVSHHMVRHYDNTFYMISLVDPVNYFLKSQEEQEAIDISFETWLASMNYSATVYFQNRYIDLSEPIKNMQGNMTSSSDLNTAALSFGEAMIKDLLDWQTNSPRYETMVYLVFSHRINPNDIVADSKEELEEKIIEKAFAELRRRTNAAKSHLRKADIQINMLPTEGLYELKYHTFNRKKAVKNRFKDLVNSETTAMYVTADQSEEHIEDVREAIKEYETDETKNKTKIEEAS